MGCDIREWYFDKDKNDITSKELAFGDMDYAVFGFLANVRNYSKCPSVAERRGVPDWFDEKCIEFIEAQILYSRAREPFDSIEFFERLHSKTHVFLCELLDYDYTTTFIDRSSSVSYGKTMTLREHLGDNYFAWLDRLKATNVDCIVLAFDS